MNMTTLSRLTLTAGVAALMQFAGGRALAQSATPTDTAGQPSWFAPVLDQARRAPKGQGAGNVKPPPMISQNIQSPDPAGILGTWSPTGPIQTAGNPFFTPLKSPNGRSCFTCHRPESSWTITPEVTQKVFKATDGLDPLFAPFDGQNCPDLDPKTTVQRQAASSQLLNRANIRIGLGVPNNKEWADLKVLRDPTGCANSPGFGLPSGVVNMYRRPLSSTALTMNGQLNLLTVPPTVIPQGAIMWDGREPSLASQFVSATMGHAQAERPTDAEIAGGVAFETLDIFTAQNVFKQAGDLTQNGATGGAEFLSELAADMAARGVTFDLVLGGPVFTLYDAWATNPPNEVAASIKRGQDLFNNRTFTVRGVSGFNDIVGPAAPGTCTTCHNNKNGGHDIVNFGLPTADGTFPEGRHLGIGDNSAILDKSGNQTTATALLPRSDMPLYEFWCPVGTIPVYSNPQVGSDGKTYDVFQTSDPGVALITGDCADLGKFKIPRLRGLAGRAPYFHGGEAKTLADLVNFYNVRFQIGLTASEQQDMVNFLNAL